MGKLLLVVDNIYNLFLCYVGSILFFYFYFNDKEGSSIIFYFFILFLLLTLFFTIKFIIQLINKRPFRKPGNGEFLQRVLMLGFFIIYFIFMFSNTNQSKSPLYQFLHYDLLIILIIIKILLLLIIQFQPIEKFEETLH